MTTQTQTVETDDRKVLDELCEWARDTFAQRVKDELFDRPNLTPLGWQDYGSDEENEDQWERVLFALQDAFLDGFVDNAALARLNARRASAHS